MKVLLFGHRGWIGGMLIELLKYDNQIELYLANSRVDEEVEEDAAKTEKEADSDI